MSLIRELRRRKVFRFGGIYIVSAWLVFQVADVFFPAWGIPDAALRYLLYAALACFPVALVFSWFFDVSAGGIQRTRPADLDEAADFRLKVKDYLVLAGLLVVAGTILYNSLEQVVESAGEAPAIAPAAEKPPNSLAVLPFENLDPDPDTGYFSDGVSEEILHRLGSIRALKVIGRTSSFPFGKSDLGLDRISDILGVRYLLGGSIRRAGDEVRLTARLVDDSGFQVWSGTFDGTLSGIFKLQADIAEQVASQISRELVVLESPEPVNPEAHAAYLIGRQYFHDRTPFWADRAAEAYRRAIEIDPAFAPPYAGLAIAIMSGAESESEDDELADHVQRLIDQALELDPELPEAWLARGAPNGLVQAGLEEKAAHLERAIELDPTLAVAYNWLYIVRMQLGRDDAFEARERGLEVDPLHPSLVMNTSDKFLATSDYAGWRKYISKLLYLPEPPGHVYEFLVEKGLEYGRLTDALSAAKDMVRAYGGRPGPWRLRLLPQIYEQLGLVEAADLWIGQVEAASGHQGVGRLLNLYFMRTRGQLGAGGHGRDWLTAFLGPDAFDRFPIEEGKALIAAGHYGQGIALLEPELLATRDSTDPMAERQSQLQWLDSQQHWLIFALQEAGRDQDAAEWLAWSRERVLEVENDPNRPFGGNPDVLAGLAIDYAIRGETGRAAEIMRQAVDTGWRAFHTEASSPLWRGAWQSDVFAPLAAEVLADIERQRAEVQALEAGHDFLAELDALLAERGP